MFVKNDLLNWDIETDRIFTGWEALSSQHSAKAKTFLATNQHEFEAET